MVSSQWDQLQRQIRRQHGWMLRSLRCVQARLFYTSQSQEPFTALLDASTNENRPCTAEVLKVRNVAFFCGFHPFISSGWSYFTCWPHLTQVQFCSSSRSSWTTAGSKLYCGTRITAGSRPHVFTTNTEIRKISTELIRAANKTCVFFLYLSFILCFYFFSLDVICCSSSSPPALLQLSTSPPALLLLSAPPPADLTLLVFTFFSCN